MPGKAGLLMAKETEPRLASLTAVIQSGELIRITDLKNRHQAGWVELRTQNRKIRNRSGRCSLRLNKGLLGR